MTDLLELRQGDISFNSTHLDLVYLSQGLHGVSPRVSGRRGAEGGLNRSPAVKTEPPERTIPFTAPR
jgi:hypothetical protein